MRGESGDDELDLRVAPVSGCSVCVRSAASLQLACVLSLVVLAAWPLLLLPLDTGSPVIRAACAATDVFGDPFHPFLPFLLNRPITWVSLQPWALRLVPLAFLAAETVLLAVAAKREGGLLAGAFAAVWFACEIRRRHGLWDLSDWDFAGTFLMAMLLVVQRRPTVDWRRAVALTALMLAGVMSSWLMIVPSGVLAGCLGIEAIRGRSKLGPAFAVGVVFALLGALSLGVFAAGSQLPREIGAGELWQGMYAELPVGRSLAMALPMALAVVWLTENIDRLAPRFAALCLVAVPAAVWVAHRGSHVAGGYYIGLITPLLLWAAAVATARATRAVADGAARVVRPRARPGPRTAIEVAVVVALAIATVAASESAENPCRDRLPRGARPRQSHRPHADLHQPERSGAAPRLRAGSPG